jgi:outer membrane protein TolC
MESKKTLMMLSSTLKISCAAAAVSVCFVAGAQLPAAPSAVLAASQADRSGHPAGSGYRFTPPSTLTGPGGLAIDVPQPGVLSLSLDDAIALGLDRNIRLKYDRGNQLAVKGDSLGVIDALLPNLTLKAQSSAQEVNLAAMGFKPSLFASFAKTGLIPAGFNIATIVKVNTTQASLNASQQLFNLPDYEVYRGIKNESAVVDLGLLNDRGEVILAVGQLYLRIIADQATVANDEAQVRSAQTNFDQASARRDAGVGIHLDVLRAQVDLQQRQQNLVAAQTTVDKDTIQLARVLGLPAGQKLALSDAAPLAGVTGMDLEAAKALAYTRRKDLLTLEEQIQLTVRELRAVRYQRLPTLAFNGFYGVIGVTNGSYHGDFNAVGTISVPLFREAGQRGEQQFVESQLTSLRQREADLRVAIDSQIRSSMLDVQAASELVKVAQSSVELSRQALSDAQDRFAAGVDDNLPVVDAEASLAAAQAQLVQAAYQYNVAKLQLARNTGVIETRYREYLGK